jgi:2-phospho-L-lactate guanylyltransferase
MLMISALVPVKSLSAGKTRLAAALPPREREDLSIYMLQKVWEALLQSRAFDWVGVVTADRRVEALARERKVHTIREDVQINENRSISYGSRICRERGDRSLLVIHADLPLVSTGEIEAIVSRGSPEPKVVICPSKEGTGTNALYRTPPEIIPACFGLGSFSRHRAEAAARQIPWESCFLPGISLDIDTPEDLRKLGPWPGAEPFPRGMKESMGI